MRRGSYKTLSGVCAAAAAAARALPADGEAHSNSN